MMGHRSKRFKLFAETNLEALLPADNFYRQLEDKLDLSFVHDLVRDCYDEMGRPSIDPVVFFKLHLIAFFEGVTSERRLMEMAQLNLAHRWYQGYDLDEALPAGARCSPLPAEEGTGEGQPRGKRLRIQGWRGRVQRLPGQVCLHQ
jgi:hypothetical protein